MSSTPFRQSNLFAIVDCDSFYNSVELNFQPQYRARPCLTLSNNDGCVVARNRAAKSLGIKMGVPIFKIKDEIEEYGIICFSSNYCLYGDMSSRVMDSLAMFVPEIEIYSIDEAWLDLSGFKNCDVTEYVRQIRECIYQWTGIPVSIGVAQTKVLAKVAVKVAKGAPSCDGVFNFADYPYPDEILQKVVVGDLWGIGRQYQKWLAELEIETALQFRNMDQAMVRKKMGVVGVRLLMEIQGFSCIPLEQLASPKKETCVSRSFGKPISELEELQEAIAAYASRAAEKLRKQGQIAEAMIVFARTSPFKANYYRQSVTINFPVATNDTLKIVREARNAIKQVFRPGLQFKKAGVSMVGLGPENVVQEHLWASDPNWQRRHRLMDAIDSINQRWGRGAITVAATGLRQSWKVKAEMRSPRYTTRWDELPTVIA